MDDAITVEAVEVKALCVAPLAVPPSVLGPCPSSPWTAFPGAVGLRRSKRSSKLQHYYRTAPATSGHSGDALLDLRSRRSHAQPLSTPRARGWSLFVSGRS